MQNYCLIWFDTKREKTISWQFRDYKNGYSSSHQDKSLGQLPQFAQAAIEVSAEAGIWPMFLEKEYQQLEKSLKKFIKIAEKRGI